MVSGGGVESIRVSNPAQAARGDSGDAVGDAVAVAEFLGAVFEETDQRPVDVAETEEAEVVGGDGVLARAKARLILRKLTRR